jgi:hypothetical protein
LAKSYAATSTSGWICVALLALAEEGFFVYENFKPILVYDGVNP